MVAVVVVIVMGCVFLSSCRCHLSKTNVRNIDLATASLLSFMNSLRMLFGVDLLFATHNLIPSDLSEAISATSLWGTLG